MSDVVSFRPSAEELEIIETTRRRLGVRTRAEAIRHLIRAGARARPLSEDPVFQLRFDVPERGRSLTSAEIDDIVYGDRP